jgi:uncharacterized protein (DUF58 family)
MTIRQSIRNRISRWLDKRIPATHEIFLGHRQLFIFASRSGWMMAAILILMLVGATNYQNSLAFALTFVLISIGLLSILKTYGNLSGLTLKGLSPKPVFAGEITLFQITGKSPSGCYSLGFGFDGKIQNWYDFLATKETLVELQLKASSRGWFHPGRIYLASEYPLGIMRCWSWLDLQQKVLVYPKPISPGDYKQFFESGDDTDKRTIQEGDDYQESRRYQQGDQPNHIDWKIFAKTDELYTKKFAEIKGSQLWLNWDSFDGVETELRLSFLCYLILQAEKTNRPYGLKLPSQQFPPANGAVHQQQCLTALATFGEPPASKHSYKKKSGLFSIFKKKRKNSK